MVHGTTFDQGSEAYYSSYLGLAAKSSATIRRHRVCSSFSAGMGLQKCLAQPEAFALD
jgi:hypothetical protein